MFKRLRRKFVILNMTMMSLAVIFAFLAIYLITLNNIENQNRLKLENAASSALRQLDNSDGNYSQILVTDSSSEFYRPYFSALLDINNKPVMSQSESNESESFLPQLIELALNSKSDKLQLDNRDYLFSIIPAFAQVNTDSDVNESNPELYRIITFIDITDSQNTLTQLTMTFTVIGILLLGTIFLISVFFAKKSVAPIEASYLRQNQFIADASHELKTPVASVSANIEAIESNPDETVSSQKRWMEYIKIELERMISSLATCSLWQNTITCKTNLISAW